jgi:hypothetical protein
MAVAVTLAGKRPGNMTVITARRIHGLGKKIASGVSDIRSVIRDE